MWTKENIPDQTGKTVIITGANTGLGFEDALALYEKGANVIMAVRDTNKAQQAVDKIRANGGNGNVEAALLDLSSLESVKEFADNFVKQYQQLHLLINNAGVMMCPPAKSKEGFELQFGVNFIGHFALTGYLYPLLKNTPHSRVVTLSSGAHKWVDDIDFSNLKLEKTYDPRREYGISKLADLLFTIELQKRIRSAGDQILSLAAHPGITRTDLQRHVDDIDVQLAKYPVVMQPWQGALPTLYAATAPGVKGGSYYGPDGENELHGYPALAKIGDSALNDVTAKKLWQYAEQITGVVYPAQ
ncbi:MAG: oxidoreductase [Mucilaginibacter sp.]|uniref:oxidoreductase n=1 Tax=Mucilaginibacter sp. TaxID=1882438 RepID=UPI00319FD37D